MKRLYLYIAYVSLIGFTATSDLTAMAGGCSSQSKNTAEIKCAADDIECKTEKSDKFGFNKDVKS